MAYISERFHVAEGLTSGATRHRVWYVLGDGVPYDGARSWLSQQRGWPARDMGKRRRIHLLAVGRPTHLDAILQEILDRTLRFVRAGVDLRESLRKAV